MEIWPSVSHRPWIMGMMGKAEDPFPGTSYEFAFWAVDQRIRSCRSKRPCTPLGSPRGSSAGRSPCCGRSWIQRAKNRDWKLQKNGRYIWVKTIRHFFSSAEYIWHWMNEWRKDIPPFPVGKSSKQRALQLSVTFWLILRRSRDVMRCEQKNHLFPGKRKKAFSCAKYRVL